MSSIPKHAGKSPGEFQLDHAVKGIPGGTKPFPLSRIAERNGNVLREDLPLPLMVLKHSALLHNVQVMRAFLEAHQLSIAPDARTHMSPQLIQLRLSHGAWAAGDGNGDNPPDGHDEE